jgi:surface antigen
VKEDPMRKLTFTMALVLVCLSMAAVPPPAKAQLIMPLDDDSITLNAEEKQQMRQAMRDVLESGKAGTEKRWNNSTTKRVGVAKLLRSFEKQGSKCGQVQHTLMAPEKGDRNTSYSMPFCKQKDGTWKIAF